MPKRSALSDDELLRLRRQRTWFEVGFTGALCLGLAGLIATLVFRLPFSGGVGITGGALVLLGIAGIAGSLYWRLDVSEALFDRGLITILPLPVLKRRLRRLIRSTPAARRVVVLQGIGLPRGPHLHLTLQLWDAPARARLDVRRSEPPFRGTTEFGEAEQKDPGFLRITAAVEEFLRNPTGTSRFPVRDGFPCDVVAAPAVDAFMAAAECNLADTQGKAPALELARALVERCAPEGFFPAGKEKPRPLSGPGSS